ncbi:hypothetical protein BH23CHL2_BH23CHL2_03270 [soil metagenome]
MEIYTIGFTQKSAEEFFELLIRNNIQRLIDVRLNNKSQLAGFTKQQDLEYFLHEIGKIRYIHEPRLAPTPELLTGYRKKQYSWEDYEQIFGQLMEERAVERVLDPALFEVPAVLLCSEPTAEHCHRRLVAEYLQHHWGTVEILHL